MWLLFIYPAFSFGKGRWYLSSYSLDSFNEELIG